MKRKTIFTLLLLGLFTLGGVGCASQQDYQHMQSLYKKSKDQVLSLRQQLSEANARIQAMRDSKSDNQDQQKQIANLKEQRDKLQAALSKAENQLNAAGSSTALPHKLNSDLEKLANQNSNLMKFDSKHGMVELSSDLTFDLGSAKVSSQAKEAIEKLASVLNNSQAKEYDIRIAGYTDNVPIKNPGTKAKFPNNWYLSAARAISVEGVLQSSGVSPKRMGVAGYSQYRPVVPNKKGGARQNRRVEIYLVPHTSSRKLSSSSSAGSQSSSDNQSNEKSKTQPHDVFK